jgi:hypothetical protein
MESLDPADAATRRTRRVLTRRRRLPFEQAAAAWARRASCAMNASSLTRPLSEQGRQARGYGCGRSCLNDSMNQPRADAVRGEA